MRCCLFDVPNWYRLQGQKRSTHMSRGNADNLYILEVKEKSMNMFHIQMLNFLFFFLAHFQMFSPATARSGVIHCYITCTLHPFPGSGSSIGCHWSRCARSDMWLNMPQGEGNVFQRVHFIRLCRKNHLQYQQIQLIIWICKSRFGLNLYPHLTLPQLELHSCTPWWWDLSEDYVLEFKCILYLYHASLFQFLFKYFHSKLH